MADHKTEPRYDVAAVMEERRREAEQKKQRPETVQQKAQRYTSGAMRPDEMRSFLSGYEEEITAALEEPERKKQAHAKAIWTLTESSANYYAEQREWADLHPQFIQTYEDNRKNIAIWLREKNIVPSAENINAAFVALTMEGRLLLDATACHAGPETEITGDALRRHPNLWKLMEPVRVRNADPDQEKIDRMSASEYKASRPELADNRTPPIIREQVEKALSTFISWHPEYIANEKNRVEMMTWLEEVSLPCTAGNLQEAFHACRRAGLLDLNDSNVSSGSTKLVDYGPRQPGFPPQPQKHSFREKIRSMSANEIANRCANDPGFKQAIDNL